MHKQGNLSQYIFDYENCFYRTIAHFSKNEIITLIENTQQKRHGLTQFGNECVSCEFPVASFLRQPTTASR